MSKPMNVARSVERELQLKAKILDSEPYAEIVEEVFVSSQVRYMLISKIYYSRYTTVVHKPAPASNSIQSR